MNKIKGIKSVDFLIKAIGFGVVNWNGNISVKRDGGGKDLNNHLIPKLRGYNNESGEISEKGFKFKKDARDINFKDNPMYVSQNCIRHHLFKDQSYDIHYASKSSDKNNFKKLLLSISGLLRGYVIPSTQYKRKSPLLITDFLDVLGNGNYEQFANSGSKDENSIYSKTTFGETLYVAKGSISIEDLQFISLDKKFDRQALQISNDSEGESLAKELRDFLIDLTGNKNVDCEYGEFYRVGSIYQELEKGIRLNQAAIKELVKLQIEIIQDLSINQSKGFLKVDSIEVDYNDSKKMFRIEKDKLNINSEDNVDYAIYYKKKGE